MPLIGQQKDTPVPSHLDRWNWGAFLLNWIWGLGNGTYIALLMFVPFVNIVMWFMLGARGNRWAWQNQQWASEEQFLRTQRNWTIAGCIVVPAFLLMGGLAVGMTFGIMSLMKDNDAYRTTMELVRSDERVVAVFGEPIEDSWMASGNINISGSKGSADFAISISGPRCEGTVYSVASRTDGLWTVDRLVVRPECQEEPIELIGATQNEASGTASRHQAAVPSLKASAIAALPQSTTLSASIGKAAAKSPEKASQSFQ